jgi:hypothetical protein
MANLYWTTCHDINHPNKKIKHLKLFQNNYKLFLIIKSWDMWQDITCSHCLVCQGYFVPRILDDVFIHHIWPHIFYLKQDYEELLISSDIIDWFLSLGRKWLKLILYGVPFVWP